VKTFENLLSLNPRKSTVLILQALVLLIMPLNTTRSNPISSWKMSLLHPHNTSLKLQDRLSGMW